MIGAMLSALFWRQVHEVGLDLDLLLDVDLDVDLDLGGVRPTGVRGADEGAGAGADEGLERAAREAARQERRRAHRRRLRHGPGQQRAVGLRVEGFVGGVEG